MAEPTYTLQRDCTQCGHEITMAGVSFPGTSRTVTVRWTCSECWATRDEVIERRAIPGQPGYGEARPPVKLVPGTVAWKPEATFGTSPRPSDAVLNLTAVSGMSDGSPPPTPADEWSKPVKDEDGDWATRIVADTRFPPSAMLSAEGLRIAEFGTDYAASAPRDVVLRLLAAEASDRLGWVWDIANFGGVLGWIAQGSADDEPRFRWIRGDREHEPVADRTTVFRPLPANSPDELLAAQHGYFLLADAIREAGQ